MTTTVPPAGDRKTGTVERVLGDYGFISSEESPEQDLYFKASWFRGSPPLREGERVTFQLKVFGTNVQAHYLERVTDQATEGGAAAQRAPVRRSAPSSEWLFDWAYLGYMPNVLAGLKGLALDERWEFKNTPPNSERPFPILHSYLLQTFGRLALEQKVLVNGSASIAAFNTVSSIPVTSRFTRYSSRTTILEHLGNWQASASLGRAPTVRTLCAILRRCRLQHTTLTIRWTFSTTPAQASPS